MSSLKIGSLVFQKAMFKSFTDRLAIIATDNIKHGDYYYINKEQAKQLVMELNVTFQLALDTSELCEESASD